MTEHSQVRRRMLHLLGGGVITSALLASGCVGSREARLARLKTQVNSIEVGKTSENDVASMFGRPHVVEHTEVGDIWKYAFRERNLWVYFDKAGLVTQYRYDVASLPPGGCFVASVVYGSPSCREVAVLRQFRDEVLMASTRGRFLVRLYYRIGPVAAWWLSKSPWARRVLRRCLDQILRHLDRRRKRRGGG